VYSDGKRIHEGFWVHGSKEGHGRCMFFPQQDYHEGEYHDNLRHGPGKYQWKNGRQYIGMYQHDFRHGHGVFTYPNGERYEGNFEKGQRGGMGSFDFLETKANGSGITMGQYKGEWKAGKYHGKGRIIWGSTGHSYEGEFVQGCMHGYGVKKDETGTVLQQGYWVRGVFTGGEEDTTREPDADNNNAPVVRIVDGDSLSKLDQPDSDSEREPESTAVPQKETSDNDVLPPEISDAMKNDAEVNRIGLEAVTLD